MSTSPRPSPRLAAPSPPESFPELLPFPYDIITPGTTIPPETIQEVSGPVIDGAAETAAHEAQIRVQSRHEGQTEAGKVFEGQMARERASLSAALAQFTHDRAGYFQKIEAEIVQLALSIARRILHRESQLDPLLLAGIVRVALEKIDGATGVTLRINPQNAAEWRRYLTMHLEAADLPEIVEDPAQPLDSCILQTSMGTAIVGMEVQLKEIEQGLMDLLAARPGSTS